MIFFWLNNVELAKDRVAIRVSEGGHNIEPDVIELRYLKGIKNLFDIYLPIIDVALLFDNSSGNHELMAQKMMDGSMNVVDDQKFNQLKRYYEHG